MAADERKVVGWFTANGKHIPIFDGGPTFAEKKKDSDIAKAKEQADILNGKQFKKNSFESIQSQLNQKNPDYEKVAFEINDGVETAGYFMYETNDGKVQIFGKNHNDSFQTITPADNERVGEGRFGMDSVQMGQVIHNNMNSGKWSLHKFDGKIDFPATLLDKKAPARGTYNAIKIEKLPTNADATKISTINGYDIFKIKNTTPSRMFEYVAVKSK